MVQSQISLSPIETTPSPEEEHPKHTRPHPVIWRQHQKFWTTIRRELQTWSPVIAPKNGDSQHRYARCALQTGHGWGEALEVCNACHSRTKYITCIWRSAPSRTHQWDSWRKRNLEKKVLGMIHSSKVTFPHGTCGNGSQKVGAALKGCIYLCWVWHRLTWLRHLSSATTKDTQEISRMVLVNGLVAPHWETSDSNNSKVPWPVIGPPSPPQL